MSDAITGKNFKDFVRNLHAQDFEALSEIDARCAEQCRPFDAALAERIKTFASAKKEIGRYLKSRVGG